MNQAAQCQESLSINNETGVAATLTFKCNSALGHAGPHEHKMMARTNDAQPTLFEATITWGRRALIVPVAPEVPEAPLPEAFTWPAKVSEAFRTELAESVNEGPLTGGKLNTISRTVTAAINAIKAFNGVR